MNQMHDAEMGLQEHDLQGGGGLQSRLKLLSHRAVPHLNSPAMPSVCTMALTVDHTLCPCI